jgi:hypothetical protein
MNKILIPYIFIFLLSLSQNAVAQTTFVKASVDKNKVLIGEKFWLTLEARESSGNMIHTFQLDSIPHFVIISKDSVVHSNTNGVAVLKQYVQITSFDSGRWAIPQIALRPNVKTASVLVDVAFSEPFDANLPYHDVQDVRDVPSNKKLILFFIAAAIAFLLIIVVIIYFAMQKRITIKPDLPSKDHPYEKAKKKLQALKMGKVEQNIFYEHLVQIFRTYILERTGIESLQQTSGDLIEKLNPLFTDSIQYEKLSQVLLLSDFVKFAKYTPSENEVASAFDVINISADHIEENIKNDSLTKMATSSSDGEALEK